jgi:hypothetical protein
MDAACGSRSECNRWCGNGYVRAIKGIGHFRMGNSDYDRQVCPHANEQYLKVDVFDSA